MDAFAQGARRARAADAAIASSAHDHRRDRFTIALVLSTIAIACAAMTMLSAAGKVDVPFALGFARGRGARGGARGGAASASALPRLGQAYAGGGSATSAAMASMSTADLGAYTADGFRRITTPMVFVSLGTKSDNERVQQSLGKLIKRGHMTSDELKRLVTVSHGVDATAWPANTHLVEYAVKDIRALSREQGKTLMDLPWLQIIDLSKQHENGMLPVEWRRLSHHVGCLYAHLFQWQLIKEKGFPKAIIFEADGVGVSDLPFSAMQEAIDRMPADADVLFTSFGNSKGGPLHHSWNSKNEDGSPVKVNMYHWNEFNAVAGLQSYVVTQSFIRKVQEYIAHKGADMVDAWLLGKMCVVGRDADWNMRGMGEGFKIVGGGPILNCYHATTWT